VELGRIATEARRCVAAAGNMGLNITVEVRAYGDVIATDAENADLSRRRAEAVQKFLVVNGVDERKMTPAAMGAPPRPGPGEGSGAGKFDRRVFFRVVLQP
jgi:outer membrane protein OmpA-like peptidoglycan-associated protein